MLTNNFDIVPYVQLLGEGQKMSDPRPYPYFGGKASVMPEVWLRLKPETINNFVDPFFGGGSGLLFNPLFDWTTGQWIDKPPIETVNDIDGYISNFWRAVSLAPDEVAHWADWPVNECDLHARHSWLVNNPPDCERLEGDPEYYDAKIAGWWVWGICQWIGSGFCSGAGPWQSIDGRLVKGNAGQGINRQLPSLGSAGRGINRKLPHLGNAGRGQCAEWSEWLQFYFARIQDRLRRVRVCCGDWRRVLGDTPTHKNGITAVFLDPPYSAADRASVYNHDSQAGEDGNNTVAQQVMEWAIKAGDSPKMRIALCGYEGDYTMPDDWDVLRYSTQGGYENQATNGASGNRHREVIYFSPHCVKVNNYKQLGLPGSVICQT